MNNENLIGIFDSGIGGLSVLKRLMPYGGNYIYFGDTKNLPYGNKSKEEIVNFTKKIIRFFIKKGANQVIMACNTSSALAYESLNRDYGDRVKIYPLIQLAASNIAKMGNRIGIMATQGTVKSLTYTKEIKKYNPNAEIFELSCPKFVPMVENGVYYEDQNVQYIKDHLQYLLDRNCDKIVLGCTHYPYLLPILTQFAPEELFVDPAIYMEDIVKNNENNELNLKFYVTSNPDKFKENAKVFFDIEEDIFLI